MNRSHFYLALVALLLAFHLGRWAAPEPRAEAQPGGAKVVWEYKVVHYGSIDGFKLEANKEVAASITEHFNAKLGQDGWEYTDNMTGFFWIFKRPKSR